MVRHSSNILSVVGSMPNSTVILGQPVLNLELLPDEGCVVLELGATAGAHAMTVTMFPSATIIEVQPGPTIDASSRIHLIQFTVTLNEKLQIELYEIRGALPTSGEVHLRVNKDGAFEVSGHVFRKGEADLAVSVNSEGRVVKTGLWDGDGYRDIEVSDREEIYSEAMRFAEMLESVADEFFHIDYGRIAREIRLTPEVANLLRKLGSPEAFKDVM